MKQLLTLSLFCITLFANTLHRVPPSFSPSERKMLLKELSHPSSLHTSKTYTLKKGWNKLTTPRNGVDVFKTFSELSAVRVVAVYDDVSKLWGVFSHEKIVQDKEMLLLKDLEPNVTFFVLVSSDFRVAIKSNSVNLTCKKIMEDKGYAMLLDTGMTKGYALSKDAGMSVRSRYLSHHDRGIYNDTRVMLIYKKLKSKTKRSYNYGPAAPKVAFEFTKEYEGQKFYLYDFKKQKCYMGIFPSMRIPPFPMLKEL